MWRMVMSLQGRTRIDHALCMAFGTQAAEVIVHAQRHARIQTISDNCVIYYQDDPTEQLWFVLRGHVRLTYIAEDGLVTLHAIMPAGGFIGEAGALEALDHCDTAYSAGEVELLCIDLAALAGDRPEARELRMLVGAMIARNYRRMVEFTRALYRPTLSMRLSYLLLQLLDSMGNDIRWKGRQVRCIGPVVTQRDIGAMARGTRENVNKALRKWQQQGILALEDRHIIVLDPVQLGQHIHESD